VIIEDRMKTRTQSQLPFTCADGEHGGVVDGSPIEHEACVNVEWFCGRCGELLGEVSWSKEAWFSLSTEQRRTGRRPSAR
jgi:hypothetical protein